MVKNMIVTDNEVNASKISENNNDNNFIKKLKYLFSLKNIKIIILVVLGVLAVVLCVGLTSSKEERKTDTSNDVSNTGYMGTMEYCQILENKLESVLSQIKGAGQVKVMVSVDGSPELVYASDTDEKTSNTASGTTTTSSSSLIVVGSEENALILTENLPKVKGVIVVSTGANNVGVKLDIMNAVATLLDISTDNVSVLKGI